MTDARLRMTNERRESLVASVVAVLNCLFSTSGDAYDVARNLAILDLAEADATFPEVVGGSVAAHWHRYFNDYIGDTAMALEELNQAIVLDARQPMLYLARTMAYQRLGEAVRVPEDVDTARQLGPEGWKMPLLTQAQHEIFFRGDYNYARELLDELLPAQVDDWWALTLRGMVDFQLGDVESASIDFNRAIALNPPANFPYIFAITLALRDGRLVDVQNLVRTVQTRFPDPMFAALLLDAAYGLQEEEDIYGNSVAAFGYFVLR